MIDLLLFFSYIGGLIYSLQIKMTMKMSKYLTLTCCLLIACYCCVSCEKKKAGASPVYPVLVEVQKIERKTIPATFEFVGVIQSSHEVEIRARVTGYLEEIAYREGSFVQKGDLLFQIDPRPFQADLAKARAKVAQQEAVLWQAQRAVKRFQPLYEQKAASQRDLDNAIANELSAEAELLAAQAQVADAELNLSYTTIRSPVSGLTAQAKYRVGSLISPAQDQMTTISVIDPIWVVFSVSEQDMLKSQQERKQGKLVFPADEDFEIELVLADQSVYPEKGHVNFTAPSYSQQTGTMLIRAVLPNQETNLRPGQFVRVRVFGATRPDAIVVPQRAIVQSKNGNFVFVVGKENKAEVRPVVLGPWDQQNWVIFGGLQPGDEVIIDGINKLLPGAPVIIKPAATAATKPAITISDVPPSASTADAKSSTSTSETHAPASTTDTKSSAPTSHTEAPTSTHHEEIPASTSEKTGS